MIDPIERFSLWLKDAEGSEPNDPNACSFATVARGADGSLHPDVRMVLLKGFDARGFVIYTNLRSAKGRQVEANPMAALCFHWKTQRRQVRIRGTVAQVADDEADAYFASRPRASQLSAWASEQSAPLDSRTTFEARLVEMGERFPHDVPRPPHWSGLRIAASEIEFWEDRDGRQHHREMCTQGPGGWTWQLLYP
jgi:pyridoxamine 5'-phosphate oxidase